MDTIDERILSALQAITAQLERLNQTLESLTCSVSVTHDGGRTHTDCGPALKVTSKFSD